MIPGPPSSFLLAALARALGTPPPGRSGFFCIRKNVVHTDAVALCNPIGFKIALEVRGLALRSLLASTCERLQGVDRSAILLLQPYLSRGCETPENTANAIKHC